MSEYALVLRPKSLDPRQLFWARTCLMSAAVSGVGASFFVGRYRKNSSSTMEIEVEICKDYRSCTVPVLPDEGSATYS